MLRLIEAGLIIAVPLTTMLGVGLGLSHEDLARSAAGQRLPLLRGLLFSVLVMPIGVGVLVRALPLPETIRVGIFLSAACPGGSSGVLLAQQGRGDPRVAVLVVVATTLIAAVSTPLLVGAMGVGDTRVDVVDYALRMMNTLLIYQIAPLLAGMLMARLAPTAARRAAPTVSRAATVILALLVAGMIATRAHLLGANGGLALIATGGAVLVGAAAPWFAGPTEPAVRVALVLTSMIRNLSAALLLGALYFPSPQTSLSILTYGLFMYVGAAIYASRARRLSRGGRPSQPR